MKPVPGVFTFYFGNFSRNPNILKSPKVIKTPQTVKKLFKQKFGKIKSVHFLEKLTVFQSSSGQIFFLKFNKLEQIKCEPLLRIANGSHHFVAMSFTDTLYVWGDFASQKYLGVTIKSLPVPLTFFKGHQIRSIHSGNDFSLVYTSKKVLFAIGRNRFQNIRRHSRKKIYKVTKPSIVAHNVDAVYTSQYALHGFLQFNGIGLVGFGDNEHNQQSLFGEVKTKELISELGVVKKSQRKLIKKYSHSLVDLPQEVFKSIHCVKLGEAFSAILTTEGQLWISGTSPMGGKKFKKFTQIDANLGGADSGERIVMMDAGRNYLLVHTNNGNFYLSNKGPAASGSQRQKLFVQLKFYTKSRITEMKAVPEFYGGFFRSEGDIKFDVIDLSNKSSSNYSEPAKIEKVEKQAMSEDGNHSGIEWTESVANLMQNFSNTSENEYSSAGRSGEATSSGIIGIEDTTETSMDTSDDSDFEDSQKTAISQIIEAPETIKIGKSASLNQIQTLKEVVEPAKAKNISLQREEDGEEARKTHPVSIPHDLVNIYSGGRGANPVVLPRFLLSLPKFVEYKSLFEIGPGLLAFIGIKGGSSMIFVLDAATGNLTEYPVSGNTPEEFFTLPELGIAESDASRSSVPKRQVCRAVCVPDGYVYFFFERDLFPLRASWSAVDGSSGFSFEWDSDFNAIKSRVGSVSLVKEEIHGVYYLDRGEFVIIVDRPAGILRLTLSDLKIGLALNPDDVWRAAPLWAPGSRVFRCGRNGLGSVTYRSNIIIGDGMLIDGGSTSIVYHVRPLDGVRPVLGYSSDITCLGDDILLLDAKQASFIFDMKEKRWRKLELGISGPFDQHRLSMTRGGEIVHFSVSDAGVYIVDTNGFLLEAKVGRRQYAPSETDGSVCVKLPFRASKVEQISASEFTFSLTDPAADGRDYIAEGLASARVELRQIPGFGTEVLCRLRPADPSLFKDAPVPLVLALTFMSHKRVKEYKVVLN